MREEELEVEMSGGTVRMLKEKLFKNIDDDDDAQQHEEQEV